MLAQNTYIDNILYHYDGLVFRRYLGVPGSRVRTETSYGAPGRRLSTFYLNTETPGSPDTYGTPKFSFSYNYDAAGNVKDIAGYQDAVADQKECFTYDNLRRLTEAWTQTSGTCGTPQRTGADPYWRQWTFDQLGNRISQTDKDPVAGDTTWTYNVGATFGVKAHQVKTITATGPKADTPTRTYTYDTAGNTASRTTAGGVGQTLTWGNEGHLATVTQAGVTTTYIYDTAGNRLVSTNPGKKTLYLPDGTELEKTGTADPLGTRYYAGIAVRDTAGLRWIVADHHGTGVAQIDPDLAISRHRSMPYGEDRTTTPTGWKGTKGYVDGTNDDTGLTHLGAREYDPTAGRFISPDPIMDLTDPNQWNPYGYANANPTTGSDPNGLKTDWDEERRYDNAPTHCTSSNRYSASCEQHRNNTNRGKPKPTTQTGGNKGCFGGDRQTSACLPGNGGDGAGRPKPCFGGDRQTGACLPGNGGNGAGRPKTLAEEVRDRSSTLVVYIWDVTVRRVTNPVQTVKDMWMSNGNLPILEEVTAVGAIVVDGAELKRDGPYCGKEAECLTGAFVPGGANGITIGHTIRFSGNNPSPDMVRHEMQHVYDIENVGGLPFYGSWIGDYVGGRIAGESDYEAYRSIYWEERAFYVENNGVQPRGWPW